jgi:protein CpxP
LGAPLKRSVASAPSGVLTQIIHAALAEGREKIGEYLKKNPQHNQSRYHRQGEGASRRDSSIRQRVVNLLSPEQLSKWDSEVAKAKEFLGQKVDA